MSIRLKTENYNDCVPQDMDQSFEEKIISVTHKEAQQAMVKERNVNQEKKINYKTEAVKRRSYEKLEMDVKNQSELLTEETPGEETELESSCSKKKKYSCTWCSLLHLIFVIDPITEPQVTFQDPDLVAKGCI